MAQNVECLGLPVAVPATAKQFEKTNPIRRPSAGNTKVMDSEEKM
jgi:hypothetical protein